MKVNVREGGESESVSEREREGERARNAQSAEQEGAGGSATGLRAQDLSSLLRNFLLILRLQRRMMP